MNKQQKSLQTGMIVPRDLEMPLGHEKYSQKDKDKCPFFQIQEKVKDIPTSSFILFVI